MRKRYYKPSALNQKMREWFQDSKFGMFIHWGIYSVLGDGEWVMHNKKMIVEEYEKLPLLFNPIEYDPAEWVRIAKNAGMRYITITSKHHDGFAMYDSKVSDYDIVDRTSYRKDVLKMLADECEKQDVKLFFYYSHLDWHHTDYYPRGRTGEYSNRPNRGDFNKYLDYMNAQIAELCSGNYGEIGGIWFDGWWDQQLKKTGEPVKKTQVDWHLEKTYDLIHKLQPQALIGNNHHVAPFVGEDFQMFEKDLPGHNTTGFSGDAEIGGLPLETCETINNSWGYNKNDKDFKNTEKLIRYLVRAAGSNANFILNVGPMPNGMIQSEFVKRIDEIGQWMTKNGDSIYGTRGGPFEPTENYVTTCKDDKIYLHVLNWKGENRIMVPSVQKKKILKAWKLDDGNVVQVREYQQGLIVNLPKGRQNNVDTIIVLEQ
jgi:alpha-L-fucosidase